MFLGVQLNTPKALIHGSISASEQLQTFSSPNPTITLNCYQLIVVGWGRGRCTVVKIPALIQINPSPCSCQRVFFLAAVGWSRYLTPLLY